MSWRSQRGDRRVHDLLVAVDEAAPDGSLRRVSNRLIEQSDGREEGRVRLVLDVAPDDGCADPSTLPAAAAKIHTAISAFGARPRQQCHLQLGDDVKVVRYPARRVFVSMVQEFSRRSDVVRFLKSLCQDRGLEDVIVGDDPGTPALDGLYQSSITDRILKEIRESDGFLQLLTLRTAEREALRRGESVHPNYGWLAYEYGIADERGLGPIRIVDVSMPPDVRRAFGVRQDNPDLIFDTDTSDDDLCRQLRHAVEKIEGWLYRRPPRSAVGR